MMTRNYRDACNNSNLLDGTHLQSRNFLNGTNLQSRNASSLNLPSSSFPTSNSSLYSNMVASDGYKPSVASWTPSPYEDLLISERIINDELTWNIVGANGHASFKAMKPKLLSKSPAPTVRPLKKLTKTNNGESKEEINFLREQFERNIKMFPLLPKKKNKSQTIFKSRGTYHGHTPTPFVDNNINTTTNNNTSDTINVSTFNNLSKGVSHGHTPSSTTTTINTNDNNNTYYKNLNNNNNKNILNKNIMKLPRQVRKPPAEDLYDYAFMTVLTRSSTKNPKKGKSAAPPVVETEPAREETVPTDNTEQLPILPPPM